MNYEQIKQFSDESNLFNTACIKVTIEPVNSRPEIREFDYGIKEIRVDSLKSSTEDQLVTRVTQYCEKLNKKITENKPMKWKLFYLYKELFQDFITKNSFGNFNYFRGQSNNWETLPGLFRVDTSKRYIREFENIYENISVEFPDEVVYYPFENINESAHRVKQLSLLQHYGLRTSLLDLTRNPYIALLFMVSDSGKKDFLSGSIELYEIDEKVSAEKNIFTLINKDGNNKRLKAQDGAFLCYDKLTKFIEEDKLIGLEKISRIIIELDYDVSNIVKEKEEIIQKYVKDIETINSNMKVPEKEDILKQLHSEKDKHTEELEELKNDFIKDKVVTHLHKEIKGKLEEYYYLEENLFPDLYKYIEYIQPKYTVDSSAKELTLDMNFQELSLFD